MSNFSHEDDEWPDFDNYPTRYIYRITVTATTFEADPAKTENISSVEEFDGPDLYAARSRALHRYREIGKNLDKESGFILPYANSDEFELGKHAAVLVLVTLVEISGPEEYEYTLIGGDEMELEEALEMESKLFGWDTDE